MNSIINQLVQQVYTTIKTKQALNKNNTYEIEIRLGVIEIYNSNNLLNKPSIQPMYTQLPNKKVVKHHKFESTIEDDIFESLQDVFINQGYKKQQYTQQDLINPDSSKVSVQWYNGVKLGANQTKKTAVLQDIDIQTQLSLDIRISCKQLAIIEFLNNTDINSILREKQVNSYIIQYMKNQKELIANFTKVVTNKQDLMRNEIEFKTIIESNNTDNNIKTQITEVFEYIQVFCQYLQPRNQQGEKKLNINDQFVNKSSLGGDFS